MAADASGWMCVRYPQSYPLAIEHTFDYRKGMEMAGSATQLNDVVVAACDAVDAVVRTLAWTVDPNECAAAVEGVVGLRDRVDALIARFMVQADRCGVPRSIGVRTPTQFVGATTSADPASVRLALARGKWLRGFPSFEAAFEAGEIGGSHLDLIRRMADGPRTHGLLVGDQDFFVTSARECSFADFKKVVGYWLITVDPDGDEPKEQTERTSLSMRKGRGGRVIIRGELDALSGQELQSAVDSLAQQMRATDLEDGNARSEGQRRAAALAELVACGATRSGGGRIAPLINIVMSQNVAEYLIAQAAEPSRNPVPVSWHDVDGRCELIDGTPIHPKHVLSRFGIATFRRHVMSADSRLLDVSVKARSFPAWMRNALHVQARGACETPGCDAPHAWMHADHTKPHSRGGRTRLSNGQNQCAADNQAKTNTVGQLAWRDRHRPSRRGPGLKVAPRDDGDH